MEESTLQRSSTFRIHFGENCQIFVVGEELGMTEGGIIAEGGVAPVAS